MTNDQIKITHHPATDTAREHWRSSDGKWSFEGKDWYPQVGRCIYAAFFNRILNAEPEPRRAKVGDRVSIFNNKPFTEGVVESIHKDCLMVKISKHLSIGISHKDYTIVPPPTATGDKITERDGVWESEDKTLRCQVIGGDVVLCISQRESNGDALYFKDGLVSGTKQIAYIHISTDPADLLKGWKGEGC